MFIRPIYLYIYFFLTQIKKHGAIKDEISILWRKTLLKKSFILFSSEIH